jgi:hypothetical protein
VSGRALREVSAERLEPLFRGVLVFGHPGYPTGTWEGRYRFDHDGRSFDWVLYGRDSWDCSIVPRGALRVVHDQPGGRHRRRRGAGSLGRWGRRGARARCRHG